MRKKASLTDAEQQVADTFVQCPHCGSRLCYSQVVGKTEQGEDIETLTCLSCGFTTSNQMLEGSETEKAVSAKHPSLYKDLRFKDVHGFVWYPAVVTAPNVGMVYIDGSSTEDWEWAFTPMRKLTRRERRSGKYGDQEYISIPVATKKFGQDGGFIKALDWAGLLGDEN